MQLGITIPALEVLPKGVQTQRLSLYDK